jgi:peptidoglycan/LPS O-acetylase OafA/YrhL
MTSPRLGWLDGLRGYAALVVVCFHLSPSVLGPGPHLAIFRHLDLGKYGVLLFFLVSGYVIPMSLERHGSLSRFWIGRLCRIYPAYLATIAVAVAIGGWHSGGVLAHATMLLDPLGLRGAVRVFWTLSYEMIFYLVVAGLFAWRLHRHSGWWASGLALVAVLAGPWLPDGLFAGRWTAAVLLVLVAGSVTAHLAGLHRAAGLAGICFVLLPALNGHPTARSTVVASWQGLLLLAVMFAGTVVYRAQHGMLRPLPAGLALAVVAAGLIAANPGHALWVANTAAVAATFALAYAARNRPIPRVLRFLGRVSYSLYLLHVLVLTLLARLVPHLADRPVEVRIAAGVAFLALALSVAWASYRLIELPGQRAGRALAARFGATERAATRTARGENVGASV